MKPLFFRDWLQVKRIKLAPHHTRTTSDALFPVINRLVILGLFGMCKKLATSDALPAVGAFVMILKGAVVRSLDRFRQLAHSPALQYRAATTAAVTTSDELGFFRPHRESIEPLDNRGPRGIELLPELDRLVPGQHVLGEKCLWRQAGKSTALNGQLAAMAVQCRLLLFAHAVNHQKTFMPLEVSIYIIVGLTFKPLWLERAAHRNDAE